MTPRRRLESLERKVKKPQNLRVVIEYYNAATKKIDYRTCIDALRPRDVGADPQPQDNQEDLQVTNR